MSYHASYNDENEVVKLQIIGLDKKEDHYKALKEVCQLCKDNNCSNLLVDLRKMDEKTRDGFGCFNFGMAVVNKLRRIKIAHVYPSNLKSRGDVRFISTVEQNRGVITNEFNTIEEALKWFKE